MEEEFLLFVARRFSPLERFGLLSLFDSRSTLIFSMDLLIAFIRCSSSVPIRIAEHIDEDDDDEDDDDGHVGVVTMGFVCRDEPHDIQRFVAG